MTTTKKSPVRWVALPATETSQAGSVRYALVELTPERVKTLRTHMSMATYLDKELKFFDEMTFMAFEIDPVFVRSNAEVDLGVEWDEWEPRVLPAGFTMSPEEAIDIEPSLDVRRLHVEPGYVYWTARFSDEHVAQTHSLPEEVIDEVAGVFGIEPEG